VTSVDAACLSTWPTCLPAYLSQVFPQHIRQYACVKRTFQKDTNREHMYLTANAHFNCQSTFLNFTHALCDKVRNLVIRCRMKINSSNWLGTWLTSVTCTTKYFQALLVNSNSTLHKSHAKITSFCFTLRKSELQLFINYIYRLSRICVVAQ